MRSSINSTEFEAQIAEMIPKPNEERVKIAFLLTLNGRAVRQVHRLLKLLYSENHFYFIHVDSVSGFFCRYYTIYDVTEQLEG